VVLAFFWCWQQLDDFFSVPSFANPGRENGVMIGKRIGMILGYLRQTWLRFWASSAFLSARAWKPFAVLPSKCPQADPEGKTQPSAGSFCACQRDQLQKPRNRG